MKLAAHQLAGAVLGLLTSTLLFCLIFVFIATFGTPPMPLKFEPGQALGYAEREDTIVVYMRPFTSLKNEVVTLERTITCEVLGGEQVYDLPGLTRPYTTGERVAMQRVVIFPIALQTKTHCSLSTMVKWTPAMSLQAHFEMLPTILFTVGEKP